MKRSKKELPARAIQRAGTIRPTDPTRAAPNDHVEASLITPQEWQTTIDAVADAVWVLDAGQRIQRCNQAAAKLFGKPLADLLGRHCWEIAHGTNQPISACPFLRMTQSRRRESEELSWNGRWFQVAVDPLLHPGGKLCGAVHIVTDITERHQTKTALREERTLYEDMVNAQPAGIYRIRVKPHAQWHNETWRSMMDSHYSVDMVNDHFGEILGISREEFMTNPGIVSDVLHPDDKADFSAKNAAAMLALTPFNWDGRLACGRWVHFESIPRVLENGDTLWSGILLDITARKRTEEALQESEERYRALFEHAAEAIVVFDPQTLAILSFNDEAARRLGYTREEFAQLKVSDFEMTESTKEIRRHSQKVQVDDGDIFESRHQTKSGDLLDIEIRSKPICMGGKTVIQGIWRDITERKRTEATLRKLMTQLKLRVAAGTAEVQRLAAIVQHSSELICLATLDLRCVFINSAGARLLGTTAAEIGRHAVLDLLPAEEQGRFRAEIMPVVKKMRVWEGEMRYRNLATGADFYTAAAIFTVPHPVSGQPHYLAITADDISARKALEHQVLEISEREQRRIGSDLHDSLGQRLAGIGFMSTALSQDLAKKKLPGRRAAARIGQELRLALEEARQIARGLNPIRPGNESLRAALHELAASITQQLKLSCHFVCPQRIAILDEQAATHLFRIAQEAVNNAARHAQAKHIWIRLRQAHGGINLSITDDGCGLPVEAQRPDGLGLRIMRYRASVIGATFAIDRRHGGGTQITCDWTPKEPQENVPGHVA